MLRRNGVHAPQVLAAMRATPRHEFVYPPRRAVAYQNRSLPIGDRQIMLPPLIIGLLLQALLLQGTEDILEIGTGTGYLTALLTFLGGYVFSLERSTWLAQSAAERLHRFGYQQIDLHLGDGSQGLPDMAPFEVIVVTSAVPRIPRPLAKQLHPVNGRMIIPVGVRRTQELRLLRRTGDRWVARTLCTVQARPLLGRYGFPPPDSLAGV